MIIGSKEGDVGVGWGGDRGRGGGGGGGWFFFRKREIWVCLWVKENRVGWDGRNRVKGDYWGVIILERWVGFSV